MRRHDRYFFFLLLSQRSQYDNKTKRQNPNISAGVPHGGVLSIYTFRFALVASGAVERIERRVEGMEGRGHSRHTLTYGIEE